MTKSIVYQNHQIKVFIEGRGEALIFLHGWPTNSNLWKSQVEVLKGNYKTITFDWLGFGKSDKPINYTYTFAQKKKILDVILSNLLKNDEKVTLIAHDIGGPPVILWASENQGRVKRLILLNTVLFPFSTPLDQMSHVLFATPILKKVLASHFGLKSLMNLLLTKSRGKTVRNRIEEVLQAHENTNSQIILKTILDPLKDAKKNEFLVLGEKFKNLNISKHLIIAKEDPLCFKHIQKLSEENPNVPSYVIDDCGHYLPIDKPNELNKILLSILKQNI